MPAPTDYTADEKRTKISMSNSEDPYFAADAVAANPSSAATPTNPDGTKKLSKSAMKKLEKQKAMGDKGKQDDQGDMDDGGRSEGGWGEKEKGEGKHDEARPWLHGRRRLRLLNGPWWQSDLDPTAGG